MATLTTTTASKKTIVFMRKATDHAIFLKTESLDNAILEL